jgi:hypothetical protein
MSPSPDCGSFQAEYRPYWQLLLLGVILALAGYAGAHVAGEPWRTPELSVFLFAAIVVLICLLFRMLRLGGVLLPLLQDSEAEGRVYSKQERLAWPLLGFLAVVASLLLLEKAYPFYFSQDDNLDSILPVMLHGCRSFFEGRFPEWNPYQFMGAPTTVLGYYGFTYPLTFFAYWFAKHFLGNANATIDVLSITHLLLGYLAMYWVLRRERCRPSVAMLAASCYSLSGYALIFTRSFVQFSPLILWAPLLIACLQELARSRTGWKWILAFGACMGLLFHAGHIQMWAYTILLIDFAMLILLLTGAIRLRELTQCAAAHLVGMAIAAPLLVPELLAARDATRYPDNSGILSGLKGLFVPVTVSASPHPVNWGAGHPIGEMYYSGTLFMLLAAILLLSALAMRWRPPIARQNVWFLCALLSFLLALGNRGIIWTALVHMPGFDRFRFPFKFLGLLNLFVMLAGASALERLLRHKRQSIRLELPLVLVVWGLLAYHCTLATAAFCVYPFVPYPQPDAEITRLLLPDGDRYYPKLVPAETSANGLAVMNGNGNRSTDPKYLDSFMNQWPTLQGVFSIHGYDPLAYDSPTVKRMAMQVIRLPQRSLAEYGVKYLLEYTPPQFPGQSVPLAWPGTQLVYTAGRVNLYELPFPRPMCFPEHDPSRTLHVQFDAAGATIDTSELPQGGSVILNMPWWKSLRANADKTFIPTQADDWGRVQLSVPADTASVRLEFRPPWEIGWLVAGMLLGLGVCVGWLAGKLSTLSPNGQHGPSEAMTHEGVDHS